MSVIPGVRRRVDPETLMATFDSKGNPLWDMPAPIGYAEMIACIKEGRKYARKKVQVPVYRGTSASYARYVKAQIRRDQRKLAALAAETAAAEAEENNSLQEAEANMTDLVLNPGGHNV